MWRARHCKTGQRVAIKKAFKPFVALQLARRNVREIKILSQLRHENIVGLVDISRPASLEPTQDLYMVLEFMPTDLDKTIKSRNVTTWRQ